METTENIVNELVRLKEAGMLVGLCVSAEVADGSVVAFWTKDLPFFKRVGMADVLKHDMIDFTNKGTE